MANVALQGGRMKLFKKKSDKLWNSLTLIQSARNQYEAGSKEYFLLNEIYKQYCNKYLDAIIKEATK